MTKSKVIQFLLCVLGGLVGFAAGTFIQFLAYQVPAPDFRDIAVMTLRVLWDTLSTGLWLAAAPVGAVVGFELVRAWMSRISKG